jgi:thiol:disulfide interchange protein
MADGQAKQALERAVEAAREQHKQVFVYVVAPWCPWCRRFEAFVESEPVTAILQKALVPVKIDIEAAEDAKEQALRLRGREGGIPWYAVLDETGTPAATSETAAYNIGFPTEEDELERFRELFRAGDIGDGDIEELVKAIRGM